MYSRKDTYILGVDYQKNVYTQDWWTKKGVNKRCVFETGMVVGLKEKVGRKRSGCPGVMSGVSICCGAPAGVNSERKSTHWLRERCPN